ncbi:MAG: hypothetical protein JKY49_00495 [Cohaesibacteraceae bacterium]|nr:hypothetical protein [Cohaesibacteraceae bacterium]MBL4876193.1 hypothetical protein [Cohaesibacteraceae bacterium]
MTIEAQNAQVQNDIDPTLLADIEALKKEGIIGEDGEVAAGLSGTIDNDDGKDTDKDRPEWLPEKFKTAKEMAESYKELEKAQGTKDDDNDQPDPQAAEKLEEQRSQASDILDSAGLSMADIQAEYDTNGELSSATYEALAKAKYPREMVDTYINGIKASNATVAANTEFIESAVFDAVGGEEQYRDMTEWAGNTLSQFEFEAYNKAVESGDLKTTKDAVEGLKARYGDTQSQEPQVQAGGSNASSSDDGAFESMEDYLDAMDDPKYATSSSYRDKIDAKLQRSNI